MYTEKVMEHFKNPRNMGELKDADGVGKVGNPRCGDVMHLYIKVNKDKGGEEIIKDIKFKTFGCVAAISTSDVICDLVKGKPIEEAMKLTKQDIIDVLGELPPLKIHCSLLAIDALKEAVKDYMEKNKNKNVDG